MSNSGVDGKDVEDPKVKRNGWAFRSPSNKSFLSSRFHRRIDFRLESADTLRLWLVCERIRSCLEREEGSDPVHHLEVEHDHVYCTHCHKVIEFQHPTIETVISEVCQRENFQMDGHSFIVRGTCGDCNRKKMTKRRLDLV